MRKIILLLLLASVNKGFGTITNETNDGSSDTVRTYRTEEVVVTGQYSPANTRESVHPIRLITESQLTQRAPSNLRDLLMTESGIRLEQDNMLGTQMRLNGIAGANVKILIDEVPVIGRMNGFIDVSQINLANVERIEIVDGPMSGVYGSDALGGVINIITKEPKTSSVAGGANVYYESIGIFNADASAQLATGKFKFLLSGGRNYFPGFDTEDNVRDKDWNPKEQYFADLNAGFRANRLKLRYSGRLATEYILNRGEARAPYYETAFDDKYHTTRITNTLSGDWQAGKTSNLNFIGAASWYERRKNTYFTNIPSGSEVMTKTASDQDTTNFNSYNIRLTYNDNELTDFLKYQVGFDFSTEIGSGDKIRTGDQSITDYAIFAGAEYMPFGFLKFLPTVRFQHNNRYDAPITPSVNFRLQAADNLFFRLGYAKGFRAPNIKELYLDFVNSNHNIHGNEDLDAEKSDNFNISANYSCEMEEAYFEVEPKFFYNKITDMITLAEINSGEYRNINLGNYETIGGSLGFKFFTPLFSVTLNGGITGTLSEVYDISDVGDKFNFAPDLSLSLGYLVESLGVQINALYKYSGEIPSYIVNSDESISKYYFDDYHILDINLSKDITNYLSLQIGGKNLLDVTTCTQKAGSSTPQTSTESSATIMWGRTFFAKLTLRID